MGTLRQVLDSLAPGINSHCPSSVEKRLALIVLADENRATNEITLKSKRTGKSDGEAFLVKLADLDSDHGGFDSRFALISRRVGLGTALSAHELELLYEATVAALECYMALNGIGDYHEAIQHNGEKRRRQLETDFMDARDECYRSSGWRALPTSQKAPIQRIFLNVFVADENLAK